MGTSLKLWFGAVSRREARSVVGWGSSADFF